MVDKNLRGHGHQLIKSEGNQMWVIGKFIDKWECDGNSNT